MKLWDSLTTCLILLSTVHASPGRVAESPPELPPVQIRLSVSSPSIDRANTDETLAGGEKYTMEEPLPNEFDDVVNFIRVTISRIRRSSSLAVSSSTTTTIPTSSSSPSNDNFDSRTLHRRGKRKGTSGKSRGGGGGRGQGCVLKQIHLNVSDLGLGYRSSEEMIFRYCSGPCRKSETNYDKILYNLIHNRRLPAKDMPPQACCRPIAFDDDLSFLDDSLVYHTVRKHSARKCGCV
uniref:Glial cell line-derived neurotrophic factor n=1 Tax=Amphilophus citrinellus TaxID=61819 RepID=A0A3Q0R6K2_AMPCI